MEFKGVYTAIVTPFKGNGLNPLVDWDAYEGLIQMQNEAKVGIVPCGTTGESPTLSHEEHNKVIEVTIEKSKTPVIAGTGSNCTWEAVEMTRHAMDAGAHATLQVAPYYNKPSQEGFFRHFGTIAEKADIPMVIYNIPGRTGKLVEPETIARLAKEYSNIVAVKEATGNSEIFRKTRELCPGIAILSGDDNKTYELMKNYKGSGVISVASNVIPKRMKDFIDLGLEGKWEQMEKEGKTLDPFFKTLFIDTNPIPAKEMLFLMGKIRKGYRLPMCETSEKNSEEIKRVMGEFRLLETKKK